MLASEPEHMYIYPLVTFCERLATFLIEAVYTKD